MRKLVCGGKVNGPGHAVEHVGAAADCVPGAAAGGHAAAAPEHHNSQLIPAGLCFMSLSGRKVQRRECQILEAHLFRCGAQHRSVCLRMGIGAQKKSIVLGHIDLWR